MNIEDLRRWLIDFTSAYPSDHGQPAIWREPIMACAPADSRFQRLQQITVADHALPQDLLPGAKTVVAWFIPFKPHLQQDNVSGDRPSLSWGRAYYATNQLITSAGEGLKGLIEEAGGRASLTPATHNFDQRRLVSLWSHKHLAHLIGLGRYGVNCQLITPKGCGGRLGSLVTDLDLGDHPLVAAEQLCLVKAGKKCGKCMKACPIGALSEEGLDRAACYERLRENNRLLMEPDGLPGTTHVCAKCQAGMPCSLKPPVTDH